VKTYLLRRLFLLPITLFAIVLVNFIILNLAPLDPVSGMERSALDEASRSTEGGSTGEEQYLLFREHYGLTLPILFNTWPSISQKKLERGLQEMLEKKKGSVSEYNKLHTLWGDRSRFLTSALLRIAGDTQHLLPMRILAINLFIRGGTRQGYVGPALTEEEKKENQAIGKSNALLYSLKAKYIDDESVLAEKLAKLKGWQEQNSSLFPANYTFGQKMGILLLENRFFRYMSKVVTLDFGTLRSDHNKLVVNEVVKRIKYSLTLSLIPMLVTFAFAAFFGMCMALYQNQFLDISLNTVFLILFSIPTFVMAPFLIEKVALPHHLPYGGFHSEEKMYALFSSFKRLKDIFVHLVLPFTCVIYGILAVQSRLSRTAVLHVLRQDHVKTAYAKGLPLPLLLVRHVGKNAAIPLVTALASSLGLILGGSLIVETVFEINGFGRFFYDAVINRDYNVVLFSAFAGSCLTLLGYLIADICYTLLDPRIRFDTIT